MKNKSKFLQKSFWLYPEDNPREYFVLIEHDENQIPVGTAIVRVPKQDMIGSRFHTIPN